MMLDMGAPVPMISGRGAGGEKRLSARTFSPPTGRRFYHGETPNKAPFSKIPTLQQKRGKIDLLP